MVAGVERNNAFTSMSRCSLSMASASYPSRSIARERWHQRPRTFRYVSSTCQLLAPEPRRVLRRRLRSPSPIIGSSFVSHSLTASWLIWIPRSHDLAHVAKVAASHDLTPHRHGRGLATHAVHPGNSFSAITADATPASQPSPDPSLARGLTEPPSLVGRRSPGGQTYPIALPFLTALALSERYGQRGRPHKRLADWATQLALQAHRRLPAANRSSSATVVLQPAPRCRAQ